MAEVQQSGPLPGEKFTQGRWTETFGADARIEGDTDGSAFDLTLPTASDVAEVGSPTIASIAIVGGFPLIIPAGTTQSITIPPSTNASAGRTDIIAARFDAASFTVAPGPVRLHRFAGTEGSTALPGYDAAPPSPDTLPLWAVTRKLGQSLNQAVVRDLRARSGKAFVVPDDGLLPTSAPLGTRATRADVTYRRDMVGSSVQWVLEHEPPTELNGTAFTSGSAEPGWSQGGTQRLVFDGTFVWVHIEVTKSGGQIIASSSGSLGDNTNVLTLNSTWKPHAPIAGSAYVTSDAGVERNAGARINSQGVVQVTSTQPGAAIRTVTIDAFYAKP